MNKALANSVGEADGFGLLGGVKAVPVVVIWSQSGIGVRPPQAQYSDGALGCEAWRTPRAGVRPASGIVAASERAGRNVAARNVEIFIRCRGVEATGCGGCCEVNGLKRGRAVIFNVDAR